MKLSMREPLCFVIIVDCKGHGSKYCVECKDEEEAAMEYGGWLKASPWKRSSIEADKSRKIDGFSCAKALFIPKPKPISKEEELVKVTKVVEKI